jgi:hypothetical protein
MNKSFKRLRIATLDGIFVLDERTGFYEPQAEEPETQDPTWVYPFIPVALALLGWGVWWMLA